MNIEQPSLCIGILTLNEEKRLPQCLSSAAFANQVVVVDSGSTDQTCEIARSFGAEVYAHPDWQGFATQRNRLLQYCRCDYIFFLDADEVITEDLREEIISAVSHESKQPGKTYWREIAYGTELKYLRNRKSLGRFFKSTELTGFEGIVHEGPTLVNPDAKYFTFKNPLLHYSRPTVLDSLKKLTQYSILGAEKRRKLGKRGGVLRGLASASTMFIRLYFIRLAILHGGPGFLYSLFISLECFFRYAALDYDADSISQQIKR